jgi:DNA-binding SARP family transcriptional activator
LSELKLYFLGAPRVEAGNQPLSLQRHKALALLAFLATTGESQRRETLAELFWPDSPRERTRSNLRRDLSALAGALGAEWLSIERDAVRLAQRPGVWCDVSRFQELLHAQEASELSGSLPPSLPLPRLVEAVQLYRGDFLKGFSLPSCNEFDEWQFIQAERLRHLYTHALEQLIRGLAAQNNISSAIPYALRWLAAEPLNEHVHRRLIELYLQDGQVSAALRQYQHCEKLFKAELEMEPSAETQALYKRALAFQREISFSDS